MSALTSHVFTYGSLMFTEVWTRVVHGNYASMPATVHGYARYAITDETYPGMIHLADAQVRGRLYLDVASEDIAALDAFEGSDYRRDTLMARLDTGTSVSAAAYIYLPVTRLSCLPWQPETFPIERFLGTYCPSRLAD